MPAPPTQQPQESNSTRNNHSPQSELGQRINHSKLKALVECFPPVVHSFGYGSGVFSQNNNHDDDGDSSMVDLILVVDNAETWHTQNLLQNPSHYATLPRMLGPAVCARLQRTGPGVYFHASICVNNTLTKYGVVESRQLQDDLQDWSYLYLAGRMHKPTVTITQDDRIAELQEQNNLPAALAAALLLKDTTTADDTSIQSCSLDDVYQQVAQLSYAGDFRVTLGAEDPLKIAKLVQSPGQRQRFDELYNDSWRDLEQAGVVSLSNGIVEYNPKDSCAELCRRLPLRLQAHAASTSSNTRFLAELSRTVALSARTQTLKGLVTAGALKSAQYAAAKLSKGLLKRK